MKTTRLTIFHAFITAALLLASSALWAADTDDDGIDDNVDNCPLVANPDQADTGSVTVWDGDMETEITTLHGEKKGDLFGVAVSAGDINSDGKDDLIIGIPGFDHPENKKLKDIGGVKIVNATALVL